MTDPEQKPPVEIKRRMSAERLSDILDDLERGDGIASSDAYAIARDLRDLNAACASESTEVKWREEELAKKLEALLSSIPGNRGQRTSEEILLIRLLHIRAKRYEERNLLTTADKMALDLIEMRLAARAALARRPDPAPATPVIDETRKFLEKWVDHPTAPTAQVERLRAILAEHDAVSRTGAGGWRPIESAPRNREIWVYAPPRDDLAAIQCKCSWHRDAGFCVDELRHVTHWMEIDSALPASPADNAGGER